MRLTHGQCIPRYEGQRLLGANDVQKRVEIDNLYGSRQQEILYQIIIASYKRVAMQKSGIKKEPPSKGRSAKETIHFVE